MSHQTKISNPTNTQRIVKFRDGSSVAMKAGQTMTTNREVRTKETGVKVEKAKTTETASKQRSNQTSTATSTMKTGETSSSNEQENYNK